MSTQTINHGLGVTPELIIAKGLDAGGSGTGDWAVWHKDLSSGKYLTLNGDAGEESWTDALFSNIDATSVDFGNDPDGSGIYLNDGMSQNYIAYFFASVDSYSKAGSFSGSSTAFIYTGFRPTFILAKRKDSTGDWLVFDDKRDGYNEDNEAFLANSNPLSLVTDLIDINSNGFKIITSDTVLSAGPVIYFAIGQPFKYANAR